MLCASNRLQELEAEQQQIQEERELLSRQKEAMKAEAGPVEQRMYFQNFYETFGQFYLYSLKVQGSCISSVSAIIHVFYKEI